MSTVPCKHNKLIDIKKLSSFSEILACEGFSNKLILFIWQWRSVSVDGLDMAKIESYLDKQGIRSMQVGLLYYEQERTDKTDLDIDRGQ